MAQPQVAIVMGSDSDWPVMEKCAAELARFGVGYEVRVLSAHRSPQACREFAESARGRGIRVIIAGAGMSAALPGVLASMTTLPVIGVPMASGMLDGLDALLSTVQMVPGVPVATVAVGPAGARNAAILAVQMLALADQGLAGKLEKFKAELAEEVQARDRSLTERTSGEGGR